MATQRLINFSEQPTNTDSSSKRLGSLYLFNKYIVKRIIKESGEGSKPTQSWIHGTRMDYKSNVAVSQLHMESITFLCPWEYSTDKRKGSPCIYFNSCIYYINMFLTFYIFIFYKHLTLHHSTSTYILYSILFIFYKQHNPCHSPTYCNHSHPHFSMPKRNQYFCTDSGWS